MSSLYATPMQTFLEFVKVVAFALVLAIIIRTFIIEPYFIPSGSMISTLLEGDRIFVAKFSYGIHPPFVTKEVVSTGDPKIGDVIVFPYPENPDVDFVKRVVGVGGDIVEIRNKQLYRNGEPVAEPYIRHSDPLITAGPRDNMPAIKVPEGKVFVLGDNRDDSRDSRYWGFVDKDTIRGRAFMIFWSSEDLFKIRWDRVGTMLTSYRVDN